MKIINKLIFFFCFGLIILFISCDRDQPTCETCYPEIFRCKINGVFWEPYCSPDPPFGCNPTRLQYYDNSKFLELTTRNDKTTEGFHLVIRKLDESGKNKFETGSIYANDTKSPACLIFNLDTSEVSYLIVKKIDRQNRVIISEFSFVAKNSCNEQVTITEGYFDLTY
ncbi:MAG: hypothetical protein IPO78_12920 [Saprospiraceae bacterium]|nr:hypothetical protein [Saprospiraceae bacterium]MBK9220652.1 hypothetical protein [Saprospiraceae bacterium]MBK9722499.1 hypothetical protein [Saprospiraceae bacterium]